MPGYGKVALAAIVGNEDGAHGISAHLYQGLNDMGWTIPAGAVCYWVGEAMGSKDFKDFRKPPKNVAEAAAIGRVERRPSRPLAPGQGLSQNRPLSLHLD